MLPIATRLKDALWSVRQRHGMESDIDRIIPYLVFEQNLSEDALGNLFVDYPKRVPEDFKLALIAQIQQIVRLYWQYQQTRKGYHKILKGVIFLENVVRYGFEGCRLIFDKNTGYHLELRNR